MDDNLRDKRQEQFAKKWIETGMYGLLHLCPRFGKTRVAINALRELNDVERILIAYPEVKIKEAWLNAFTETNYNPPDITFTTFRSLHKYTDELFDLFIIDEIHLLSENQIDNCKEILDNCERVMGLSGTISSWTERVLREDLGLRVRAKYTIHQAIKEGVLPDYEIRVIRVPLDNITLRKFNKKRRTEKKRFDAMMYYVNKEKKDDDPSFFLRLKILEILQTSLSKLRKTKELIEEFKDDRLLVFCGRIESCESLDIPSYHSKSKDKSIWDNFITGKEKHMAVIKIGNMGATYTPLNKSIINSFDSNSENLTQRINRCMSLEYDNPDKKAIIYIVSSNEGIELRWLKKALSFFDKNKIKYI